MPCASVLAGLLSHAIPCLFMFLPMVGIRRRSASKVEGEPSGWKTSTSCPGLNHVAPPLTSCRVGRLFGVPPPRVDEHEARVVRLIWRGASSSSSSAASCSIGKGSNDTRGGAVVVVVVGGGDFVVVVGGGGSRILVGSGAGAAAGGGGFGLRAGGGWYRWSGGGGGGLRP